MYRRNRYRRYRKENRNQNIFFRKYDSMPDRRYRRYRRKRRKHPFIWLLLLIAACAYAAYRYPDRAKALIEALKDKRTALSLNSSMPLPDDLENSLVVDVIDVGQADCTLIRQGNMVMLFDCGAEVPVKIRSYLKSQGVEHIDSVWLSHNDSDHIGAFPSVAYEWKPGTVFQNGSDKDTWTAEQVSGTIQEYSIPTEIPARGNSYPLGDASVTVLGPVSEKAEEENDRSLAIKVSYGGSSFLFCGDASWIEETAMIDAGTDLKADVLHVNHHGSASSTSWELLESCDPEWAVISVGSENDYGHPAERTLEKLDDAGVKVVRTDENGTIRFISDGEQIRVVTER